MELITQVALLLLPFVCQGCEIDLSNSNSPLVEIDDIAVMDEVLYVNWAPFVGITFEVPLDVMIFSCPEQLNWRTLSLTHISDSLTTVLLLLTHKEQMQHLEKLYFESCILKSKE